MIHIDFNYFMTFKKITKIKTYRSISIHVVVCLAGIDFAEKESSLGSTLLSINVSRSWKSAGQNFSCIIYRCG